MHGRNKSIIERRSGATLHARVVADADTDRTSETIAAIPGIVEDARQSGIRRIDLDVTRVDSATGCELLPTIVLTCREAIRNGIALRVIAGDHLRASASVAGLSDALALDA